MLNINFLRNRDYKQDIDLNIDLAINKKYTHSYNIIIKLDTKIS